MGPILKAVMFNDADLLQHGEKDVHDLNDKARGVKKENYCFTLSCSWNQNLNSPVYLLNHRWEGAG